MSLERLLADELDAEIRDLTRLTAGASRETWSFLADWQPLVLQRERGASLSRSRNEADILRLAHAGGVRVPAVVRSSTHPDHPLGSSFIISEHVSGESIAKKILRDPALETARSRFVDDCARELVAIHSLDADAVEDLRVVDDPIGGQRKIFDGLHDPHPVLELAFRWLDEHRPPSGPTTLVHGDFRLGNLLVAPTGIAAVLDWELPHLGDPAEDLGWLCARPWRFGHAGEVGGMGSRSELLAAYEAAGGHEISPDTLLWWEVMANVRWGIVALTLGAEHRTGGAASLEQAAIGRRVAECEYDILLLLLPETLAP